MMSDETPHDYEPKTKLSPLFAAILALSYSVVTIFHDIGVFGDRRRLFLSIYCSFLRFCIARVVADI